MKNNKLIAALFALDLWIAATLITSMFGNMFFADDKAILITFCLALAVVNAIFAVLIVSKINNNFFSKKRTAKRIIKN